MSQHRIRINQISAGVYACTGAASILSTPTPIADAARELRKAGHPDSDTIAVDCGEITVMPATIGAILRPRPKVLRSDVERQQHHH
jgi:hypothetical protein